MDIIRLDIEVAEAMKDVFGGNIFERKTDDGENTITVTLSKYAILKCHGFDGSVRVELGAKMFILERDNYWRITIE